MKKQKVIWTLFTSCLVLVALALSSGCKLSPGTAGPVTVGSNGVVSVFGNAINPAAVKTDLKVAARAGSIAAIRYDANARAYLQSALGVLQTALDEEQYDPTNISQGLQNISIKEARDPQIIQGVNDVLELYQSHFGDVVSANLDKNIYVRPMLEGIRDGVQQALAMFPARPSE